MALKIHVIQHVIRDAFGCLEKLRSNAENANKTDKELLFIYLKTLLATDVSL